MVRQFSRKLFSSSKSRRISETSIGSSSSAAPTIVEDTSKNVSVHETDSVSSRQAQASLPPHKLSSASTALVPPPRSDTTISDRTADPLGLSLVHNPLKDHSADIIFIHGLGGSSRSTWSKHRRTDLFWPAEWLPKDEDLERTRIFTFGYNAHFRSSAQSSALGITDFSKNLLFDLLFASDSNGGTLDFGKAPIIFVAHSMGGLVFKKAFLDAQLDSRYATVINSIKAVIFLSTPHRGSDLAPYLNRLLSLGVNSSSKQYVAELTAQAPFLRTINEQFRHVATGLQIFSFYETLESSIGFSSALVLDPESAKLGYPGEISRSLNADHYSVCKFESPQDPSYKVILGALKSVVTSFSHPVTEPTSQEIEQIGKFLCVSSSLEHDLDLFCGRRAESTCKWVLEKKPVCDWLSSSSQSGILRLHGRPGRGKSVIAAFLAEHLREHGIAVQYFFFRAGDESKRSMAALIKNLAFQVAQQLPSFRDALIELAGNGYKLKDADWRTIWKKLFAGLLFEMEHYQPIYWIIDGLDEAQSPHHLFDLLADISNSKIPVKVLITSRWSPTIFSSFNRLSSKLSTSLLSIDHDLTDMRIYVKDELKYNNWGDEIKEAVITKILAQSNDNFLWVHLILEELRDCNTEEDIKERLLELPPGMDGLYRRMEETIANIRRPSDMNLARHLLQWAVYAQRPLRAEELMDILELEFGRLLDISQTANRLCGHFIAVEGNKNFGLIHQTAREYLTSTSNMPFSLKGDISHAVLFKQSLSSFMDKNIRSKFQRASATFFEYRAISWPHHLEACEMFENGDEQLDLLARFFSHASVLVWIHALASLGQLKMLIHASQALASFIRKKRRADAASDPSSRRYDDLESLETWSRDLLKVLGKFGGSLSQRPELIYTGVAPFCPTESSIYKVFAKQQSNMLTVKGQSEDWDDCLTRVSIGGSVDPTRICCSARYLAVGNYMGLTVIWDSTTFRQISVIEHGETVSMFCFSASGGRLATYGHRTTKIWDPHTGRLMQSIPNSSDMQAKSIAFTEKDAALLVSSGHHCVFRASLADEEPLEWHTVGDGLMISNDPLEGTFRNAPSLMAISPDGSKVAIVYRRYPLSIWSINPTVLLNRVTRPQIPGQPAPLSFVSHMSWHPAGDEILGLFGDGYSFKLNLVDGSYQEQSPTPGQVASNIICSPDGLVYAICGVGGTIKLFDYKSSTLIYQLNSEGVVRAFSFSSDGRRFCDIRSGYCTIWEPNALMRLTTVDDDPDYSQAADDSVKQSQVASEMFVEKSIPILLMSPVPHGPVVCFGDENGAVELLDYDSSERIKVGQTAAGMGIKHLAWSDSCDRFCFSEMRGSLSIVQIEQGETGRTHRRIEKFKAQENTGRVTQLLFLPGVKSLLVASPSSAQLWSLEPNKLEIDFQFVSDKKPRKWIIHPHLHDHLISVAPGFIRLHKQSGLEEVVAWKWDDTVNGPVDEADSNINSGATPQIDEEVEDIYSTFYQDHIMVKVARKTESRKLKSRLLIFDSTAINTTSHTRNAEDAKFTQVEIPEEILHMIEIALNVLPNGKLVFIDHSFWVCSWKLKSVHGIKDVERHFFIPRDWLPVKSQGMLHLTASGAIICPRKGGVSVISNSIGSSW